jgi:hypothetical protein
LAMRLSAVADRLHGEVISRRSVRGGADMSKRPGSEWAPVTTSRSSRSSFSGIGAKRPSSTWLRAHSIGGPGTGAAKTIRH